MSAGISQKLQKLVEKLRTESVKYGMKINYEKSKEM